MATQAINQWMLDEIKTEQAYKDAELATRIVDAYAGTPDYEMSPDVLAAYKAAVRTLTTYATDRG
jgi:hypothetical protein